MQAKLQENIDITHLSNYKTPARARYYYEINSEEDISCLYELSLYARENNLKILTIWWGTNMLFAFDIYEGIIIKNNLVSWEYDIDTKELLSYSAASIWDIAESLEKKYNTDIWHRFIGLPGSIGGAIWWNAWCFGLEVENNFKEVYIYDIDNNVYKKLSKEEMKFSYRSSILKEGYSNYFIVYAVFDLSKVVEKYSSDTDNIYFREHKQPKWNTCWSFFKNPSREQSAWYLIEQVWLKWYKQGWALFSDIHANFLMHDGNGSYRDLLELIDTAKTRVRDQFWIELINEVQIITN